LRYDVAYLHPALDAVHSQIDAHWRHRATGEEIETRMRQLWSVRDGLLASCDEFHDSPRVEAFFRLIATMPATDPIGRPPAKHTEPDAIVRRMRSRLPVG